MTASVPSLAEVMAAVDEYAYALVDEHDEASTSTGGAGAAQRRLTDLLEKAGLR